MKYAAMLLSVMLASTIGHAQSYKIDINDADNPVTMPGWTGLDATHTGDGGSVTVGGVNFWISSSDGARLRGTVGSPNPDALVGDFAFDDGAQNVAVILNFGGAGALPAGTWEVKMYIWDQNYPGTLGNMIAAYRVNNAATIVSSSVVPMASGPAITFQFESDGAAAYDVFVRENNSGNRSRLNAVELTPVVAAPAATAYSQAVLGQSPLEYYRMATMFGEDGDAFAVNVNTINQSTPAPSLTSTGTPAFAGHGSGNTWATLPGTGSSLSDLVAGWSSDEGTISYWVRLDGTGDSTQTGLMGMKTGGGGVFGSMNDTIATYQRNNGSFGITIEGVQINAENGRFAPNEWRHLAMTWNRNTGAGDGVIRVYVDGVEEAAGYTGTWDSFVIDEARFGKEINGDTRKFRGSVDDIAVWTRELTQQEVVTQYWRGKSEKAAVVFTEGFQGMPYDDSSPYTAQLNGQNGWVSPNANVVVRGNLSAWTQVGGESAYAAGSSSPAHKTFGTFADDSGVLTLEFSGRANGHKSLYGIGQENAGTYAQLLWFGVDGSNMRISAYDGSGTHQQTTTGFSTAETQDVRMRLVVDVAAGTGSMSYHNGTAWQSPAALQNVNLYLRSGRAANEPANWNAAAIAGNPGSFVIDNLVVAYEPLAGTVFLIY